LVVDVIKNLWGLLDHFILVIKNRLDNICVGCDGPNKPTNMINFLILKFIVIEKIYDLIEKWGFFIKDFDFF
jgi:hypothetical protein